METPDAVPPMDAEFVRLVNEFERASSFGDYGGADAAHQALWRWHCEHPHRRDHPTTNPDEDGT